MSHADIASFWVDSADADLASGNPYSLLAALIAFCGGFMAPIAWHWATLVSGRRKVSGPQGEALLMEQLVG